MLSHRLINSRIINAANLVTKRCLAVPSKSHENHGLTAKELLDFDPENYSLPLRPVTMNDCMEPYGPWKTAYEAERKNANWTLAKGIATFSAAVFFFLNCGVFDAVYMPNLDNIMEETERYDADLDKEEITRYGVPRGDNLYISTSKEARSTIKLTIGAQIFETLTPIVKSWIEFASTLIGHNS